MEPEVTYAELKFPQTGQQAKRRPEATVRTTVSTPGKTPASASACTKSLRALGLCCVVLLVVVITVVVLAVKWSNQLRRRTVEVEQGSANITVMSERVRQVSEESEATKANLTQLLSEYAKVTGQLQDLSESLQLTNQTLQGLLEKQRQAAQRSEQTWQRLAGRNQFHCTKEDMRGNTVMHSWSCLQGWTLQDLHCYYFSKDKLNWWNSKTTCDSFQSKLVIVNNQEEQLFLHSRMESPYKYWIGYSDSDTEGMWFWVDGSSSSLWLWKPRQPDNSWEEDCATTEYQSWSLDSWNDDNCGKLHRYICERDADQVDFDVTGAFN